MRRPGKFKYYTLQFKDECGDWNNLTPDSWKFAHNVYSPDKGWINPETGLPGSRQPFNASGDCWQQTGVHGCLRVKELIAAVSDLAEANPEFVFRGVVNEIEFKQSTIIELQLPER